MAGLCRPFLAATIGSQEKAEAAIQEAPVALTLFSIQGPLWPCHFSSSLMKATAGADTSFFD